MAPSKAFNVPGLGSSYLICQNPALFGKYQRRFPFAGTVVPLFELRRTRENDG